MIDGSMGEGGGQVLRSALALSLITGRPLKIVNIRAGRKKPGLLRQHLTAVNAAVHISNAEVHGNEINSTQLTFHPGRVIPGRYHFSVGTAGSATLVLQTVLPSLITAESRSELVLEGGTHNPYAPPFDFLEKAFLPVINKMGPEIECRLFRAGYFPSGGGKFSVSIGPVQQLARIELIERGEPKGHCARAFVSRLSPNIGRRELQIVRNMLGWGDDSLEVVQVRDSVGPGNVLVIELEYENICEVFTGFGERGVPAEEVARTTVQDVKKYLASDVPVGRYLADQLLLPMSLAGKGSFLTMAPSRHTLTNIEVIQKFLDIGITCEEVLESAWLISIGSR